MNIIYNTQQEPIILKEYGRNVQNLVTHACKEPDKKKRTALILEVMGLIERLASMPKESVEKSQRIWDDLHIISDFKLDIETPYPAPKREALLKKPDKIEYPKNKTYSRYGKNIKKLLERILAKKDPIERSNGTLYLGRLLNTFHSNWNKSTIDNVTILKSIEQMSEGKLTAELNKVERDNLFEKLYYEKRKRRNQVIHSGQRREKKPYARRHTGTYRK